jgi:predicted RNase H-like HicB family nuclease
MAEYIALLHKDADSDYGVSFPDFPGCVTAGRTLDEARRVAAEALAFHIEGMIEDGQSIPAPCSLDAAMKDRDNRNAVAFIVTVPDVGERAVRVNVTLPESLLKRIDERTTNRSGFLAKAAGWMIDHTVSGGAIASGTTKTKPKKATPAVEKRGNTKVPDERSVPRRKSGRKHVA